MDQNRDKLFYNSESNVVCINSLQKKHPTCGGMMNCQIAKHKEEVKRPSQIYTSTNAQ